MSPDSGKEYSNTSGLLYREKEYEGECPIVKKTGNIAASQFILSWILGCGTGSHSLYLTERGYEVTGVDRSQEMLDIAIEKSQMKGLKCNFIQMIFLNFRIANNLMQLS